MPFPACPVLKVAQKDKRFQRLRDIAQKKGLYIDDDSLNTSIQMCREYRGYAADWYPSNKIEEKILFKFIRFSRKRGQNRVKEEEQRRREKKVNTSKDHIANLYDTLYRDFRPEVLQDRIGLLSWYFRDEVDALEEANPGVPRNELIAAEGNEHENGYKVIMARVFERLRNEMAFDPEEFKNEYLELHPEHADNEEILQQLEQYRFNLLTEYNKILANKERLAAIAAITIGEDEGFIVSVGNSLEINFDREWDDAERRDEDKENDGEDFDEDQKGDRFVDFRTKKLMETLSPKARRVLSHIPMTDGNGNEVTDDLGITRYLSSRQAAIVLQRVLNGASSGTMMSKLQEATERYPWMQGLIDQINEKPETAQIIYGALKKAETLYVNAYFEDGHYKLSLANTMSAGNSMMAQAGTNMSDGNVLDREWSIYTEQGTIVSEEKLDEIKTKWAKLLESISVKLVPDAKADNRAGLSGISTVEGIHMSKATIDWLEKYKVDTASGANLDFIRKDGPEGMAEFLSTRPQVIPTITRALRGLGFDVTDDDVRSMAMQTSTKNGYSFIMGDRKYGSWQPGSYSLNKLSHVILDIQTVWGRIDWLKKSNNASTGQNLYRYSSQELKKINACLALTKYLETEPRVVNESSSLSTYNNMNIQHQVFDELRNVQDESEEAYQQMLKREFLDYEGMTLRGKATGWLAMFKGDDRRTDMRSKFRVVNLPSFNHTEYAKMSKAQKLTSSIMMYIQGGNVMGDGYDSAYTLFELPIQGDYSTSYDFVYAPKRGSVDEFADEVEVELERIAAIKQRISAENAIPGRAVLSVYEEQGQKIQIFPELNDDTEFLELYDQFVTEERYDDAHELVKNKVAAQLEKVWQKDKAQIEELGILQNKSLNYVGGRFVTVREGLYSKDGRVDSLNKDMQQKLRDYSIQSYYARVQATKVLSGGLCQFDGIIDFEKRNMWSHATRTSLYTKPYSIYEEDGPKYLDKSEQNVAYIDDENAKSAFFDRIVADLEEMHKRGMIDDTSFNAQKKAYERIKSTDGTGVRTLASHRDVMIMTDQWTWKHEYAYRRIMKGEQTKEDLQLFMQQIKPVYTGFERVQTANGTVKLAVLHKYSEIVLFPSSIFGKVAAVDSTPMNGLAKAQEALAEQGKQIDLFLFESGCKIGKHSGMKPFAKDSQGVRILKSSDEISNYIQWMANTYDSSIHHLDYKYFGIAASTPVHMANEEISRASQLEKAAFSNIREGDKVMIDGKEMDALEAREMYYRIKSAGIIEQYNKLMDIFSSKKRLGEILRREIASKSYNSPELMYALAQLEDGSFALPFYAPNVQHQVESLIASLYRSRITKPKTKGVNVLVSTALGYEQESEGCEFDDTGNYVSNDKKLGLVFDDEKHGFYCEVAMPIIDDRLLQFADENGEIGPERLKRLVEDGVIDEDILYCVASRTPSDAEHSAIPCKIKWFSANIAGATVKMPKEVMVMTGQDFDGDKTRWDFIDFRVDDGKVRAIKYKDNLSPLDPANSAEARENMMVKLMFAQLSSSEGHKRVLIPGGCEMSSVNAKTVYLLKKSGDANVQKKIAEAMTELHVPKNASEERRREIYNRALATVKKPRLLYNYLIKLGDGQISSILRTVDSAESPFSISHATDAFEYIMGGSEMIGIYAKYNSSHQMLQRADLHYVNQMHSNKKDEFFEQKVSLFGHTLDKLFDVRFKYDNGKEGELASLALARLLNAAVDNNKNPILGYINQTKDMAEITTFLLAAGVTEQQVHLMLNQPAVLELGRRLSTIDNRGFVSEARELIDNMLRALPESEASKLNYNYMRIDKMKNLTEGDLIDTLNVKFSSLVRNQSANMAALTGERSESDVYADSSEASDKLAAITNSVAVLSTLCEVYGAARNLSEFITLCRPETNGGAIGSTVADAILKGIRLSDFQNKLEEFDSEPNGPLTSAQIAERRKNVPISGMSPILRRRESIEDATWDKDFLRDMGTSPLQEVTTLNTLEIEGVFDLYRQFFPYVKETWVETARQIAGYYKYKTLQEGTIKKILNDMVLWKLLQNKKFQVGESESAEAEHKRLIVDVPKQLRDLKARVARAKENPGTDPLGDMLASNQFLDKLTVYDVRDAEHNPRIKFNLGGPAIEGDAAVYRAYWHELINCGDPDVRKLGFDLFKYNIYANGFAFGMYEFAHMAPISVIRQCPNYREALAEVMNHDFFADDADTKNFIEQYFMNHWEDKKFLSGVSEKRVPKPEVANDGTTTITITPESKSYEMISGQKYIIVRRKEQDLNIVNTYDDLYRVERITGTANLILTKVPKLGKRLRNGQAFVQYSPEQNYREVEAIVPGNNSSWGSFVEEEPDPYDDTTRRNAAYASDEELKTRMAPASLAEIYTMFGKVIKNADENDEKNDVPDAAPAPTSADEVIYEQSEANYPPQTGEDAAGDESGMSDADRIRQMLMQTGGSGLGRIFHHLTERTADGEVVDRVYPESPTAIAMARKQRAFVRLNRKLRDMLRRVGVDVGVLTHAEARLAASGITDFETARVTAEGLIELIRIANGIEGEYALPEEFAHVAIEMLGKNHPLVQRLFNALNNNETALREAFGDMYEEYMKAYQGNMNMMVEEAAGKLVAKELLRQEEVKTRSVKNLIHRIVDAIKDFFRRLSGREIRDNILDAEQISSQLARQLLGGALIEQGSLENISSTEQFYKKRQAIEEKRDAIHNLLDNELKRLALLNKRRGPGASNVAGNAIDKTTQEIAKLNEAITNKKTEEAILNYFGYALDFLVDTESSLTNYMNNNTGLGKANSICKKLNIVRDTLYSFAKSIQDIKDAINSGEVINTPELKQAMADVEGLVSQFFTRYRGLGRTYLENMLRSVYGDNGLDVTIGRQRGRHISIEEMATRADRDVSFMTRWFSSLADCNDFVLNAIDSMVRDAKRNGRSRAADFKRRMDVITNNLFTATGSRDQSFMFEYELGEDGKMHKTGKYISSKAAEKLPKAQRDFYNEIMKMKREIDEYMPESLVKNHNKIVMLRKYTIERALSQDSVKSGMTELWEGIKNQVLDNGENVDDEYYETAVDFEGNRIDSLPIKYLNKGLSESYDDMTDDVATSVMAYAGMACEYDEMNNIICLLENAKYMAEERQVGQYAGDKPIMERIRERGEVVYQGKMFTKKAAYQNLKNMLDDFFQMHIYGKLNKNEGNINVFGAKVSKRKLVNMAMAMTSYSQMAINLPQRIANMLTGDANVVIEAAGKGAFSVGDMAWARVKWMQEGADRLAETGKVSPSNKLSLLMEKYDIHQDNGRRVFSNKYGKSRMSKIFSTNLLYSGLTIGEDALAGTAFLACMHNYKVKNAEGKEECLWDAFEVKYTDTKNKVGAYVVLKPGYTKLDGSAITEEELDRFAKKVIALNFEMQGIYNTDDRSAVQQSSFGALLIMYRKWIAPAIKRRYAGMFDSRAGFSTLKGDFEEGYYSTFFHLIADSVRDGIEQVNEEEATDAMNRIARTWQAILSSYQVNKAEMTPYELGNMNKAITELSIVMGLFATCFLLGKIPPTDHDGNKFLNWSDKLAYSQLLRLRNEIGAIAPTPMFVSEALKILRSPFAAIGPIRDSLKVFQLLYVPNYVDEVKSGRYKGHSRAYKYFRELPIISMWKRVDNFLDPSAVLNFYKNGDVAY